MFCACTVDLPAPGPDPIFTRMGTDIDASVPDDAGDAEPPAAADGAAARDFELAQTDLPDLGAPPDADPDGAPPVVGDPDSSKPECQCAPDEACVNGEEVLVDCRVT